MSDPRFSVLLPTHYRPDTLGLAIQSVLAQTEGDLELLVVGDGVTDDSRDVVAGFTDPRLRWFDLPKGPGFGYTNRNIALRESRGALMAYAADDDLMFPDHLARLGAMFDDPAVQWALAPALWVSADGIAVADLTNLWMEDERRYFRDVANTISGGCVTYRASAFSKRDAIDETLPARGDWHMFRYLLSRHGPPARVGEAGLMHFTAGRKSRRDSDFGLLRRSLRLADSVDWWPDILRAQVRAGESPQEAYWRVLTTPGGADEIRLASMDVVRRMALERLDPVRVGAENWLVRALRSVRRRLSAKSSDAH